jgi:hypothetical protein
MAAAMFLTLGRDVPMQDAGASPTDTGLQASGQKADETLRPQHVT